MNLELITIHEQVNKLCDVLSAFRGGGDDALIKDQ
jgi:hypothetical protein